MSKKIRSIVTLKVPSCEASSKPPLGSTIGQFGVPIMDFCNLFNKITMDKNYKKGILVNCVLYIFHDFSFDLVIKNVDLSYLIKVSLNNKLVSGKKNLSTKKGRVQSLLYGIKNRKKRQKHKKLNFMFLSSSALFEIGLIKYNYLSLNKNYISYYKTLYGSCRSMGIFIFSSKHINSYYLLKESFLVNLLNSSTNNKNLLSSSYLLPYKAAFY